MQVILHTQSKEKAHAGSLQQQVNSAKSLAREAYICCLIKCKKKLNLQYFNITERPLYQPLKAQSEEVLNSENTMSTDQKRQSLIYMGSITVISRILVVILLTILFIFIFSVLIIS